MTAKSSNINNIFKKEIASVKDFERKAFTIPEIIRIANITRRQVSYWVETGLLKSTFQNVKSLDGKISSYFSRTEVIKLLIFWEMKNRGFSLQQIKKVARNLDSLAPNYEKKGTFILSDGYSVYFAETERQVIDILKHARQMVLIAVEEQLEKLKRIACSN